MAKNKAYADTKSDLIGFQRLLEKHFSGNLSNSGEIGKAITQLNANRNGVWLYEDVKLEFLNLDLGKTIRPILDNEQCKKAILELRFTKMKWLSDDTIPLKDPIQDYQLQLILKISDSEALLAKCAWHFEKHPDKKSDGTKEDTPEFHHPIYHLHFGGYEITDEEEEFEYGKVLIVEAPRIMHPPMDIVLAVDFVINNFYSYHQNQAFVNLVSDPEYITIVKNAREKFWRFFALGFASNFATNHSFGTINHVSVNSTHAKNLFSYSEKH